jgi:site-specific recombinase XerD
MSSRTKVKVAGVLAPYASGFGRQLRSCGYTDVSTAEQLRLMAHLSRWMAREGLDALSCEQIAAYCQARKADGYVARLTPGSLGRLRAFLQAQGVLSAPPAAGPPASLEEQLLGRYQAHLADERGLVPAVVSQYLKAAALFLAAYPGTAAGHPGPGAAAVSAFCARELPRRSPAGAADLASALRSFLRFLPVEGLVVAPVAQAVPAVANRKGCGLPRALPPATVARLLASCDRRTRLGRRDYAMLMLLARLGLRAGEVASLSLDDLGWRAGELTVHGKGGRDDRLPLPCDVGAALAAYLRSRPRVSTRTVFLRAIAPVGAMTSGGVTWAVYNACDRSGVPRAGAHRLRHSLATQMLATGSSLAEVGQVLRHARVATTAIYAKVDHRALDALVLPWPGDRA